MTEKSTGPNNTTSTRFNATKHGLLAAGVTELDDAEGYRATLSDLVREKDPVGPLETFLVRSAALDIVRLLRARRLEADYITQVLIPPIHEPGVLANRRFFPLGLRPRVPTARSESGLQMAVVQFEQ